jgi:lipopolysaccharide/colanic/teichoic acid biosynthesis glycosyltransferase
MLGISLLIKLTSKDSILFKQKRCGLNGRKFIMFKFRTMVENADGIKDLLREKNEMDGPAFKITNDPRLTKVGSFLRKFSLDELPQLFNVLKGEMALVGPRPPLPREVSQYDPWQRRKLSMKPGLTCLWQTNGRNNINFEKWMKMDLEYIDNWSFWLDTKILFKTIPAVILGTGAK